LADFPCGVTTPPVSGQKEGPSWVRRPGFGNCPNIRVTQAIDRPYAVPFIDLALPCVSPSTSKCESQNMPLVRPRSEPPVTIDRDLAITPPASPSFVRRDIGRKKCTWPSRKRSRHHRKTPPDSSVIVPPARPRSLDRQLSSVWMPRRRLVRNARKNPSPDPVPDSSVSTFGQRPYILSP